MSLGPILIGSRRFGVHEEDSDYDYLLIIPNSEVPSVLSSLSESDIIEYSNTSETSLFTPFRIGYRIQGISSGEVPYIGKLPKGSIYDICIVPRPDNISDSRFILENLNLYRLLYVIELLKTSTHTSDNKVQNVHQKISDGKERCYRDMFPTDDIFLGNIKSINNISEECISRMRSIRKYTKANGIYGGAYPDGTCYLIYCLNTIRKGYSQSKALRMIHQKCLYYDKEYQYSHISYVSSKSFKHMENIINSKQVEGKYRYRIDTNRRDEVLRLSYQLLDISPYIMYITNDGIIHASSDSRLYVEKWIEYICGGNKGNSVYNVKCKYESL